MAVGVLPATANSEEDATPLQEELKIAIDLIDQLLNSSESTRPECAEFIPLVKQLSKMLRAVVRLTSAASPASIYDRPIRRISADVAKNLERAVNLVQRGWYTGILRRVFLTTAGDFEKVSELLKSSIGDLEWLIGIFDEEEHGGNPTIPPIAKGYPHLAYVWTWIAWLHMNPQSKVRIESANSLAMYASNEHYRKVIVEEGGISLLLSMLKDGGGSEEAQIAATTALLCLVDEVTMSRAVADELRQGFPLIAKVLRSSPIKLQNLLTELVARVAEVAPSMREELGIASVIEPLLSCLLIGLDMQDYMHARGAGKNIIHSIVKNELAAKNNGFDVNGNNSHDKAESCSDRRVNGDHRTYESPEVLGELKTKCALALRRLSKGSVLNSQKIVTPKGLFCLSKIIETESGQLQMNCLLTIMEVAQVAEHNTEFRKLAWKPSLPSAKAVLDQLLRVIKEEETNPGFQVPCIKAIGSLARIFPAKETGFITTLVTELGNANVDVATEAVIALLNFAHPDNHNCVAHSKTIIDFNGVPLLMKLVDAGGYAKEKGLDLLCYLSTLVGNSKALADARALRTLEGAVHSGMVQTAERRENFSRAMRHLMLYQDGEHHLFSHSHGIV